MRRLFTLYVAGVVMVYGLAWAKGWELGGSKRGFVPQGVRQAPGGYRSFHFWRGGK